MSEVKLCPKCESDEFVATEFGLTRGRQIGITTGLVKKVTPWVYVCCQCGYMELWVDKADLSEVRSYYLGKSEAKEKVGV